MNKCHMHTTPTVPTIKRPEQETRREREREGERDREPKRESSSGNTAINKTSIHKNLKHHSRQIPAGHPTVLVKLAVLSITEEQKEQLLDRLLKLTFFL